MRRRSPFELLRERPILFYSSNDADSLRKSVDRTGVSGWISKGDLGEFRSKVRADAPP